MFIRTVALAAGLVSGVVASQLPEFAQQYRQRLGGAIDALSEVIADVRRDADAEGISLNQALERMSANSDTLVRRRGHSLDVANQRLNRLIDQRQDYDAAGSFGRVAVFLKDADNDLVTNTYGDFEPAVPVTSEGVISAGAGGLAGFLGLRLLSGFFGLFRRRRSV